MQAVPHLQDSVTPQGPEFFTPCAAHPLPNRPYSQLNGARRLCYSNSQQIGHSTDLSPPTVSSFKEQRRGQVASTTDTGSSLPTAALLTLSRGLESPGAKAPAPGEAALGSAPVWLELNQPWRADDINPLKAGAWERGIRKYLCLMESCTSLCLRESAFKAPTAAAALRSAARESGTRASC